MTQAMTAETDHRHQQRRLNQKSRQRLNWQRRKSERDWLESRWRFRSHGQIIMPSPATLKTSRHRKKASTAPRHQAIINFPRLAIRRDGGRKTRIPNEIGKGVEDHRLCGNKFQHRQNMLLGKKTLRVEEIEISPCPTSIKCR